jgi:hypothetical protein
MPFINLLFKILMKKVMLMAVVILFSVASVFATTPTTLKSDTAKKAKSAKVIYTCPMHRDVVSYKPGKCPKPHCGMTLVKKSDLDKKTSTMKM